jgi:trehalose 6-phosphate phosphatase
VTVTATLDAALEPLRSDPTRAAILLDVDGTLAPIVRHAADAQVPEATRALLIAVARRYGVVACVSGRRATTARQIVSIGSIAYVGNHGCELLGPGAARAQVDPAVEPWTEPVQAFAKQAWTSELQMLRVRSEDKGPIAALHWRGAPDEDAALAAVRAVADRAEAAGFATHWGRKVLEIRPPVPIDKGRGVSWLLRDSDVDGALYAGDDVTDFDAFRALRALADERSLTTVVCVGVRSDETPPELDNESDVLVDGPTGVRGLLQALLH